MTCLKLEETVSYNMSKLAKILRIARAKSGLRNKEIADMIGKSEQTISGHLSKNNSHVPDIATLKKYSELFNIPLMELLNAIDEEDEEVEDIIDAKEEKLETVIRDTGLWEKFANLSEEKQQILLDLAHYMDKDVHLIMETLLRMLKQKKEELNDQRR